MSVGSNPASCLLPEHLACRRKTQLCSSSQPSLLYQGTQQDTLWGERGSITPHPSKSPPNQRGPCSHQETQSKATRCPTPMLLQHQPANEMGIRLEPTPPLQSQVPRGLSRVHFAFANDFAMTNSRGPVRLSVRKPSPLPYLQIYS